MLNKNDPLIGAVQEVMKRNQFEREAAKLVNEKFGVTDRKAMPHERLGEWDAAYKTVLTEGVEALDEAKIDHPNKKKLDVAEPYGELTSDDFKKLRAMKEATFPGAPSVKMPMKTSKHEKMYNDHHRELKSLADSGKINTPEGKKQASGLIDRIQGLVDKHLPGSPVPSKKIWLGEEGDPSKAIRGDVVTGGSSVTTVKSTPKPTSIKPSDQAALKKKILSIKEENLEEKAVSKAQQRFMGLVDAIKRGKAHGSAKAEKAARNMSAKSVRDYAKTSEKGLPEKVSEAMNQPQIRGQSNVAGARLSGSFTTQGALPRPPRPAIDSAPRPQQASPMMGQGAPGIKRQPGGARPSVVAKNTPTTSAAAKEVAGARLSGSFTTQGALPQKPASAAKTGPSFERTGRGGSPSMAPKPADRPNDLGKAGVPGTGGKLAPAPSAAAPKVAPAAAPPAAAPKPLKTAGASTRDATLMGRAQAGGGQKLSTTFKSGGDRLAYFAARNRANK